MKILLLGKNGQLGWELQRSLAPLGQLTALDRQGADGLCGDLADVQGLAATVQRLRPDVIVNAAAYTAVDRAESEPGLARRINAEAPAVLAQEALACGALLVHYSTDYVFDGSGEQAWREDDATGPLNVYGSSKLAGEQAIAAEGGCYLIFRTSWVHAARGANFAHTMLRLAAEREILTVIDDQWGAPTGADLIADVSAHAIVQTLSQAGKTGLYHLAASGCTSWFGYAQYLLQQARNRPAADTLALRELQAIPSHDYPMTAQRPHNSRLDTGRLRAAFGLHLPTWQEGIERLLAERGHHPS